MVNAPVLIEDITYGEQDGTGDVYATISIRKYRQLSVVATQNTGNSTRTAETAATTCKSYTIKSGDTLSAICRDEYGDANLYEALADYNSIKNPNLIYAGDTLQLPAKSVLTNGTGEQGLLSSIKLQTQ